METLRAVCAIGCAAALLLALTAPVGSIAAPAPPAQSLFAQSAEGLLARDFNRAGISYLVLEVHTASVLASHWENAETAVPVGSLVKPFTALAYGSAHGYRYPQHVCAAGQCWLPRGHGRQDLIAAIANSCNAYFRALAGQVTPEQIAAVAEGFSLDPPASGTAGSWIGLGREWALPPIAVARAYAELVQRRTQPGIGDILEGMRRSAASGTGAEVGRRLRRFAALVKTGTAACSHHPRASADGFVIALLPADNPTILLLLRVHGTTGAHASLTAGQILHVLEEQSSVAD
jgi:cell division protein FtsI/penicillin-binding protein 2